LHLQPREDWRRQRQAFKLFLVVLMKHPWNAKPAETLLKTL